MLKGIGSLVVYVKKMMAKWPQKMGKIIIRVPTPTLPSYNGTVWLNMVHLLESSWIC